MRLLGRVLKPILSPSFHTWISQNFAKGPFVGRVFWANVLFVCVHVFLLLFLFCFMPSPRAKAWPRTFSLVPTQTCKCSGLSVPLWPAQTTGCIQHRLPAQNPRCLPKQKELGHMVEAQKEGIAQLLPTSSAENRLRSNDNVNLNLLVPKGILFSLTHN